jgi:AcrR family transcriptional regulator
MTQSSIGPESSIRRHSERPTGLANTDTLTMARTRRTPSPSIWGDENELLRVVPKQKKARLMVDSILSAARYVAMEASEPLTTTRVAEVAECSAAAVYRYFRDVHEIRSALAAQDRAYYVDAALLYGLHHTIRTPADILEMHFELRSATLRQKTGPIPTVKRYLSTTRPTESEMLARFHLSLLQPPQIGVDRSSLLRHLELLVRLSDALIQRAFCVSPDGDPATIESAKTALRGYISTHSCYKTSH